MDDARRFGALLPIGIHMAHHIMAHLFLPGPGHIIVDVIRMGFQLRDLFLRDHRPAVLA